MHSRRRRGRSGDCGGLAEAGSVYVERGAVRAESGRMAQNGKPLPPQLDQNSTKELNLTVLQRMDRHVEDILTTAAHVTFYQFDTDASQWVGGGAPRG